MKRRTMENRLEYEHASNEAERIKKRAKREFWERLGGQLEDDFTIGKKLLYSLAKSYRRGSRETCSTIKDKEGNIFDKSS